MLNAGEMCAMISPVFIPQIERGKNAQKDKINSKKNKASVEFRADFNHDKCYRNYE
jgi:hypothetical protein